MCLPLILAFFRFTIDFIIFNGYTQVKDEKGETVSVVFVEAKKGKGILTREELLIKKAVVEEKM